jgi:hypothetical protein
VPDITDRIDVALKEVASQYLKSADEVRDYLKGLRPIIAAAVDTALQNPTESNFNTVRGLVGAAAMRVARETSRLSYTSRAKLRDATVAVVITAITLL